MREYSQAGTAFSCRGRAKSPVPSLWVDRPSGVGSEWPSISGQTHTLRRAGVSQLGSADTGLRAAAVQPRLAVQLALVVRLVSFLFSTPPERFSLVQFSSVHSVMSDSLGPHESQHARPPCPSQTPGVYSNSCPSSWWCHPAISSSVVPFSSCPNPSQHQGLFQWVNSLHEVAKVLEFQQRLDLVMH